jgi:hypothetical protein
MRAGSQLGIFDVPSEMDQVRTRGMKLTLAHVRGASDLALVLLSVRVDSSLQLQQTVIPELGGVGNDLVELVLHSVMLHKEAPLVSTLPTEIEAEGERTRRTVSMNTVLEFERHKKVA